MAAKLYSSGVPIKLAAIVGNGMVSFLTSDPTIKSLKDLKGKEIAVAGQGATPDYVLRKLLKSEGLDPDQDLRLSYALPYPEAAAALAAGKIASALLPEPFATLALSQNASLRSPLDIGALWTKVTGQTSYPMSAFVINAKLVTLRPDAVKIILDSYKSSIDWVVANPREAGLLVEKNDLGLKAPIATKAIPRSNFTFMPAPKARAAVETLLAVFLEIAPASVGGRLPDEGFYAPAY
jgi:NitT/TauT family transport system substrate-binding protein